MGGVISQETSLAENALLKRLAGKDSIVDNDPFWNQLFSFNLKIDDNDSRLAAHIESSVGDLLQSLMHNTRTTGNVASLIRVFLRRAEQLRESEQYENKIFLWQCANSLIVLRYVCAFLTQRMSEAEILKTFDKGEEKKAESDDSDSESEGEEDAVVYESTAEQFLHSLIEIIVELPVTDYTMDVQMEGVRCLLTLLSTQLYRDAIQTDALVFGYLLKGVCSSRCMDLSRALLHNYLHHNTEYRRGNTGQKQPESIVFGLAASVWSVMQLVTGGEETEEETEKRPPASLGSLSALLLLTLACHPLPDGRLNPVKDALQHFLNAQEVSSLNNNAIRTFKMDYSVLYERLCATVRQEPPMLLLYLLLHRNSGFRNYVLSRINLENLVIPVVRCLFDSTKGMVPSGSHSSSSAPSVLPSQHHTYLSLIVILILSEDDFFCKLIHETMVTGVEWAEPDRPLGEISLGGLIALVFIRAIHRNTLKTRDRYLHTNCLAALANMSSCFKNLAPIVCQKLIGLLEAMTKRHQKLVEHLRSAAEETSKKDEEAVNYHEEITVLEEGIRTALEIGNAALAGGCLRHNPNLIYTLLYHRSLFDSFSHHPMFQDLMVNIGLVISHFSSKILDEKSGDGKAVLARIEKEAIIWPTDRLKKFPELKFRYVEDDNTVDFFVPYIWRLIVEQSTVHFDPSRIRLYQATRSS